MGDVARFAARFRGLERAHGIYEMGKKRDRSGKVAGRAKTVREPLTEAKWKAHLEGKSGIGIVPVNDEGVCWFGAIDVDVYDLNHEHLEARIKETKLPLTICRTKSGGAHLFLFTSKPVSAKLIREKLMEWAVLIGHPGVEIFPKQEEIGGPDDVGSWINLPYYGGDDTTRYALSKGKALSLKEFLDYADGVAICESALKKIKAKQDPSFKGAPPCLEHLSRMGFPRGTRNMSLYNLGVYCKLRYGDDWKGKLRKLNDKYIEPSLPDAEVTATIKQLAKKKYFYTCKESPIVSVCNKAICSKREFGISQSGEDIGATLDGLAKLMTQPEKWFVNVNGKRVRLDSTKDLLQLERFEEACVGQHNIVLKPIKRGAWKDILRELMEKVEEIDVPDDATEKGHFLFLLEAFCQERGNGKEKADILLERAYTEDGRTFFRGPDLVSWMGKRHRHKMSLSDAWALLRECGAERTRFRVRGRMFRVWSIPAFAQEETPKFERPKIVGDEEGDLY